MGNTSSSERAQSERQEEPKPVKRQSPSPSSLKSSPKAIYGVRTKSLTSIARNQQQHHDKDVKVPDESRVTKEDDHGAGNQEDEDDDEDEEEEEDEDEGDDENVGIENLQLGSDLTESTIDKLQPLENDAVIDPSSSSKNEELVPVNITWNQGGNKVYVTGTFTGWRKMIRLSPNSSTKDGKEFSTIVNLPPGTHRIRFVVDNELKCSDELPTATDSMGNLVNYIEVEATDLPRLQRQITNEEELQEDEDEGDEEEDEDEEEEDEDDDDDNNRHRGMVEVEGTNDEGMRSAVVGASSTSIDDQVSRRKSSISSSISSSNFPDAAELMMTKPKIIQYTRKIPEIFSNPELSESAVMNQDYPIPPSLPPHLETVILNTNSTEKDDSSVLPIPNHVILNHLATTSIKHNVLSVASVSRYSRKYVTQILYAPL